MNNLNQKNETFLVKVLFVLLFFISACFLFIYVDNANLSTQIKIEEQAPEEIEKNIIKEKNYYEIANSLNIDINKELACEAYMYYIKYEIPFYVFYAFAETESEFKRYAKSRRGPEYGRGVFQISEILLKEFNIHNAKKYTTSELYNISINTEIAVWYLERIKSHYFKNEELTWEEVYLAYNVGPSYIKNKNRREKLKEGWYLYNGKYVKYNAYKRFTKKLEKYYNYFENQGE